MKVRPWRTSSSRVASLRGMRTSSSSPRKARHMPDAPLWRFLRDRQAIITRVLSDFPVFNPSPSPRARQDGRHGGANGEVGGPARVRRSSPERTDGGDAAAIPRRRAWAAPRAARQQSSAAAALARRRAARCAGSGCNLGLAPC